MNKKLITGFDFSGDLKLSLSILFLKLFGKLESVCKVQKALLNRTLVTKRFLGFESGNKNYGKSCIRMKFFLAKRVFVEEQIMGVFMKYSDYEHYFKKYSKV